MECPLSETGDVFDALGNALRAGSWQMVSHIAGRLCAMSPPGDPAGTEEYLRRLRETLIVARAARADAQMSLSRIRAAARFMSPAGR
jgi:hypothetical protein